MMNNDLEQLRYPIGRFELPAQPKPEEVQKFIEIIIAFPAELSTLVLSFDTSQLNTVYRPGGWTIREVVHHVLDSHINAYCRFKWALTEEVPEVKTYKEGEWVVLPDVKEAPVEPSLQMLMLLHDKWGRLLKGLSEEQWNKKMRHPKFQQPISLKQLAAQYAWHCQHHYYHVQKTALREGWI